MRIELSSYPSNPGIAIVRVSNVDIPSAPLNFSHEILIVEELYLARPTSPFTYSKAEAGKHTFNAIRDYGKKLYHALFPTEPPAHAPPKHAPPTHAHKLLSDLSGHNGRILLTINSNCQKFNLDEIPWEYTFADVPLVEKYIFVRMVPSYPPQRLLLKPPLHLIVMAPDPIILPTGSDANELHPLYLDKQYMNFIDCFKSGKLALTLEKVSPATLGSLKNKITSEDPNLVLHIMGHSTTNEDGPALQFEREDCSVHLVNSQNLPDLHSVRLVFLAACHTYKLAQDSIKKGATYAIGSYCDIPNKLIQHFEIEFYQELARGHSIEAAFKNARLVENSHSDVEKSKFTGAMILYSATHQENDGRFECKQGKPIVNNSLPTHNLDTQHKRKFLGRKQDLLTLIKAIINIPWKYQLHTIRGETGQGKTTLITHAVYRRAYRFPGGIHMQSFETIPKASDYFKNLAGTLFSKRKELKEIRECDDNKIDNLKAAVTRALANHKKNGTCLLILDHAESLKYEAEKQNSDAFILWNWLRDIVVGTSGVVVLVTSTEFLGWKGESRQELKGMVDDENIQPATKLFCQWVEQRKRGEMDKEPKKDELLRELVKAVNGHPKSLEELGKQFGSPAFSSKSLADFVNMVKLGVVDASARAKDGRTLKVDEEKNEATEVLERIQVDFTVNNTKTHREATSTVLRETARQRRPCCVEPRGHVNHAARNRDRAERNREATSTAPRRIAEIIDRAARNHKAASTARHRSRGTVLPRGTESNENMELTARAARDHDRVVRNCEVALTARPRAAWNPTKPWDSSPAQRGTMAAWSGTASQRRTLSQMA